MTEHYKLVTIEDFAATHALLIAQLEPACVVRGPRPIFLGGEGLCDVSNYDGRETSPEINRIDVPGAVAMGRTEFVLKDGQALYPGIIDPSADAFMLELENRGSVDLAAGRVSIFPRAKQLRVKRAISLLGQCNGNYAHWVTEVLARFVLIDDLPDLAGVPLLVDHPVHEKLLDALDFLNVTRREIINVLPWQKVQVDLLTYITPPSMTPPETRSFFEKGSLAAPRVEQFHFSRAALARLRERVVPMAKDCLVAPRTEEPWCEPDVPKTKRLFLRREAWTTGNGRLLSNADTVNQALEQFGFGGVNIADHSFEGQVLTACEMGVVVSPIGAALANLVFREPGAVVVILTPFYRDATFYYFANLMAALGHHLIFVLGPQARHGGATVYNRDFRISLRLLREAVRKAVEIVHQNKVRSL